MRPFCIRYRDRDPGCPVFSMVIRAHDKLHAEELFFDDGDEDWVIVSIRRLDVYGGGCE